MRLAVEGLLKALRARPIHAETEDMVHAYLKTPEGFDMVIVDAAWEHLSIHGVYQACRSRSKGRSSLSETHLMVLLPAGQGQSSTEVVGAFNDGADTVLRQPLRPLEFLNACRTGEHLSRLTRNQRQIESDEVPAVPAAPVEKAAVEAFGLLSA